LKAILLQIIGGMAVGVPGQIRGLKAAHKEHGKLQWKALFKETIRLAKDGFKIHKPAASWSDSNLKRQAVCF